MSVNKLLTSFLLCVLYSCSIYAQNNQITNPKDTIAFSDENTKKIIEFGNALDASITNENPDFFNSKLYKNVFIKRVLDKSGTVDLNNDYIKGYIKGMKNGLTNFSDKIIDQIQTGSSYDFIKYRYDYNLQTYFLLFRLYSSETGLNYHDFRIHKKDDEIQFSDIYIYVTGENLTNTLARLMQYSIPKKKILGLIEAPKDKSLEQLLLVMRYKKAGNFKQAYEVMNTMTSEFSKEKFFLIFKSLLATHVDDEAYLKSLEELIIAHENDPTIGLNKVDYYIMKGDYFEAIQVIDQLQDDTEDDFLNYIKANVAYLDENYSFALNFYKYTAENYPDFFDGQAGYLNTLVMMKQFTEATTFIDSLIADGYERDSLIEYIEEVDELGENILEPLANSEAYKSWKLKSN